MKKWLVISILFLLGCRHEKLKIVANLPYAIKEVSGMQKVRNYDTFWMVNDAGNSPILFSVNDNGDIEHTIKINFHNHDWEDLATDDDGNLYIGDFGNNKNQRQNLTILKIHNDSLKNNTPTEVEKITFTYPNQQEFPPEKTSRFFDCEAFFFLNDSLYLFTKSRVEEQHGKTTLYKLPAKPGHYIAEKITDYNTPCDRVTCWVTSADISPDKTKVVLLTPTAILLFTDFENNNFLDGKLTQFKFDFITQKESVVFKDNNTLYLADEYVFGIGGNLYEFSLK